MRQRWVGDGEKLDVGDRVLHAIRPPVFDSPTTRGLYDPTTGVYWASDSFATPMLSADRATWPTWTPVLAGRHDHVQPVRVALAATRRRRAKFQLTVDRVEALGASYIAGCHTPIIGRDHVGQAIDITRKSADAIVAPQPDQGVLDQIQLQITAMAH